MNFGDILEKWENQNVPSKNESKNFYEKFAKWIDRNDIIDKDLNTEESVKHHISWKKAPCDELLDLHGLTGDEAKKVLHAFVEECIAKGCKKILVIHGKGIHSSSDAVLKKIVTDFIKTNEHCGASGTPGRELGGSGATWIVLK